MIHSMDGLQVKDPGVEAPETGLKDCDAKAVAYTAETGSYMYMCPEVSLFSQSGEKSQVHMRVLSRL